MDLNATLLVQMAVFAIFVIATMRYIWRPLAKVLKDRQQTVADGLAAAEEGHKTLELAELKSKELISDAKVEAAHIIEQTNQRAAHIIEESKSKAREEGERLLKLVKDDIAQEYMAAKEQLMKQVSTIAVAGAEKILQKEVDKASNDRLVDELVNEIT